MVGTRSATALRRSTRTGKVNSPVNSSSSSSSLPAAPRPRTDDLRVERAEAVIVGNGAQSTLDAMLQDDGGMRLPGIHTLPSDSSSPSLLPKRVQHDVDELKFYLDTIQSGVKPAPVRLPTTSWPRGMEMPPSTVSSVASVQSTMLPWGGSTASSQERNYKQWEFSSENPAVVRIRGPGDYTFDASAQDTASVDSESVVRVTIDTINAANGGVRSVNSVNRDSDDAF